VRLLANPIVLRMVLLFFATGLAFWVGVVMLRHMRRSLGADASFTPGTPSVQSLPLDTYNAVIQQLKQQKHELQSEQQVERRRAKTSENISAAVLSNLPTGVLFFTPDGLVRQANGAAKRILGFASPLGVKVVQIFREAQLLSPSDGDPGTLAAAIDSGLTAKTHFQRMEANYITPTGEERALEVTLTSVFAPGGEMLGATCALNDQSELVQLRRQQEWLEEISAEMALDVHNSLNTISGYAQRMVAGHDPQLAAQLAADIAVEAAHLNHTVGGFLAGASSGNLSDIKVALPIDLRAAPAKRVEQSKMEQI
jgi:nitrogen fixation/metabolism regulation signal transduction histidine kinase